MAQTILAALKGVFVFVRLMDARVSDETGVARAWDRWRGELAPHAPGRLGATAGISEKGDFVAIFGYASQDAARRDAEGHEMRAWLHELARYLEEPPRVSESCDADFIGADPVRAGFVQVVHAHSKEVDRLHLLWARIAERADDIVSHHPALISAMVAWRDDGCVTQTLYFTSEQEARIAANDTPPGLEWIFEEWLELAQEERFINLREPWITSAPPPLDTFDQPEATLDRAAAAPPVPAPGAARHHVSGPPPPPPRREELLVPALEALLRSSPTLEGAAIITAEGLPIVNALPEAGEGGRMATLGSALRGVPQRADARIGTGPVSHMFVEGLEGQVILMLGDNGAHLVAVASKYSPTVQILSELEACRDRMETALREDCETLRHWARRAERHAGRRPGLTTDERQRLGVLEREVKEFRRAGEILKAATAIASRI